MDRVYIQYVIVIGLFWITTKLYRSNKNIIQLAEMTGKKWLKIIVGVVVFVVLLINYSSIIRIFPETVKIVLLQDFKIEFINTDIYACYRNRCIYRS